MPVKPSYADRVFTTEVVSYPEMVHIGEEKDFTPVIEKALELGGYEADREMTGINGGKTVMTGFGHGTVLGVADQVISTVDIKADEVGIIELAQILNRELIIISREDIKKVEDRFVGSEFVKKQIGVSCVSEPCALLASNGDGKFLEQKYIQSGIKISIYEEKFGDE